MNEIVPQPPGDSALHVTYEKLDADLGSLKPPRDAGELVLIVVRKEDGYRETPKKIGLSRTGGVIGDAWARKSPDKVDSQITLIRADVARLFANGQPLSLSGDNLVVNLDLSLANLPAGSRLQIGSAIVEVTPAPHNGCAKFRQRFGADALRLTANPDYKPLRLRGIHARVIEEAEIAMGDQIKVLSRACGEALR